MKTPEEIRKRLKEYREDLLKKDIQFNTAIDLEELDKSCIFFESLVTLEGSIKALKWVLNEIKNDKNLKT